MREKVTRNSKMFGEKLKFTPPPPKLLMFMISGYACLGTHIA